MGPRLVATCLAIAFASSTTTWCQPPPEYADVAIRVFAADGKTAAPGVPVRLQPKPDPDGVVDPLRALSAVADDEGRFTFGNVPEGDYAVTAGGSTQQPLAQQDVRLRGATAAEVSLVIATYQVIRGRLLDPAGQAALAGRANVLLRWRRAGSTSGTQYRATSAQVGDQGRFHFVAEVHQRVEVGIHVPNVGWWTQEDADLVASDFSLGDVRLQAGGALRVSVTNAETGVVVEGAWVRVYGRSDEARMCVFRFDPLTGKNGLSLAGIPPGEYRAYAYAEGFTSASPQSVQVSLDAAPSAVSLALEPTVRLAGVVLTGPGRQPASGAWVKLSGSSARRQTDATGRFEFPSVRKGSHQLTVKAPPYLPVTATVEATKAAREVEVLTEQKGMSICGRVTGDDGGPAADILVAAVRPETFKGSLSYYVKYYTFTDLDQSPWNRVDLDSARTDVQGRFEIAGLPAGTYDLCVMSAGLPISHHPAVQVANDVPAPTVELTVGWRQPLLFHGTLTAAGGRAVCNQRLLARCSRGGRATTLPRVRTTDDGTYWFRVQQPGTYDVRLNAGDFGSVERKGIAVTRDAPVPRLDLQLTPPRYTRDEYGSLAGVVYLPDGKTPARGAVVFPFRLDGEEWFEADYALTVGGRSCRARTQGAQATDARGRFVVSDLPPGRYGLCASPKPVRTSRALPATEELAATDSTVLFDLTVEPKQAVTDARLTLRPGGIIRGTVRAAESGKPLAGARLTTFRRAGRGSQSQGLVWSLPISAVTAITQADGTFELPCLSPGSYRLSVYAANRKYPKPRTVELATGQVVEGIEVKLELSQP